MADVLKIRCRKLLFKWSPQNNRGDLLMLLSCARGHQTWHDGGLWSQEPPSLMRTMADLKWQHSPTCWTSWRHLFPSCGQLIQVTVELLAVTNQVAKSVAVVIELREEQPRSDGWHKLKDVVILSVTVQGISVDAVDLEARMLYLKEKRSFPMYNHHFVLPGFCSVLFQYDKRAYCILNQVLMCLYVCNSRTNILHWYSHVMVDCT